jgi:hypothetical protein
MSDESINSSIQYWMEKLIITQIYIQSTSIYFFSQKRNEYYHKLMKNNLFKKNERN